MTARLVFLSGTLAGKAIELHESDVTFGRHRDRTVRFGPEDILVSAEHATLLYRDGDYILRDDGSRNGTYVNTVRIEEQKLNDRDLIQFGASGPGAQFRADVEPGAAATLDQQELAEAVELLAQTKAKLEAPETAAAAAHPLTSTRELMAMVVRRGKRNRRWILTVAAVMLAGFSTVVIWQQRSRSNLERTLAGLSVTLESERASRSILEETLAQMQNQADSMSALLSDARERVERDPRLSGEIIRQYSRSVALLVYSFGYVEEDGTRFLRYVVDDQGNVVRTQSADGRMIPSIMFGGSGPPLQRQGTATGFLIDSTGYLLTNRHVTVPWDDDDQLVEMRRRGLNVTGRFMDLRAFFPPGDESYALVVEDTSSEADVALMRMLGPGVNLRPLPLAPSTSRVQPADQLVLIGYPTGVQNLVFRVSGEERGEILRTAGDDVRRLAEELARRRLIQPLILFTSVSDTTGSEVIHSELTTVGGSGGPLIDRRHRVVAVHYASVRSAIPGDPFQTQRGVPIRFAWPILPPAVQQSARQRGAETEQR